VTTPPDAYRDLRKMSDRKFVAITLMGALVLPVVRILTRGMPGWAMYQTSFWLLDLLFGSFESGGDFHWHALAFGTAWPWVAAGVVISMRSRHVAKERLPTIGSWFDGIRVARQVPFLRHGATFGSDWGDARAFRPGG
jgi:hypothetical protein